VTDNRNCWARAFYDSDHEKGAPQRSLSNRVDAELTNGREDNTRLKDRIEKTSNVGLMNDAQRLASALNALTKSSQFSNIKARAAARQEPAVNWPATKSLNAEFNPEVDGFESFAMNDGSTCAWAPGQFR
jgi:uncharacterized protein YaeQ